MVGGDVRRRKVQGLGALSMGEEDAQNHPRGEQTTHQCKGQPQQRPTGKGDRFAGQLHQQVGSD